MIVYSRGADVLAVGYDCLKGGGCMARKSYQPGQRDTELLEKLLVLQLHTFGAAQDQIAKVVGRQKLWVNDILKRLPKEGGTHGKRKKKKAG